MNCGPKETRSPIEIKNYELLSKHEWILNKIVINNQELNSYPYSKISELSILNYCFYSKTYRQIMFEYFQRLYNNNGEKMSRDDKSRILDLVDHTCLDYTHSHEFRPWKTYYFYSYSGHLGGGNCAYRIDSQRLELLECGCMANCTVESDSIKKAISILSPLAYLIAENNIKFIVTDNSLILEDNLHRRLIFKAGTPHGTNG